MAGNYLPRKEPRRALAFVLSLALLVSSLGFFGMTTEPVYAEEPEEVADPIEVIFSFVYEDTFEVVPQKLTVKAGMAYDYGIGDAPTVYPTVLDAVVAAHEVKYGSNFTPESAGNYLDENLLFAFQKTAYFGHAINRTYNGEAAKEARLYDGDLIEIFCYLDESFYDYYTIFSSDSNLVEAGSDILLTLKGFCYGWDGYLNPTPSPVAEAAVSIIDMKTGEIIVMDGKTTDSEGQVVLNFDTVGKYYISATGTIEIALTDAPIIPAWYQITVIDPTEPHVTVRIEGNGYGTDGINDNIKEVIQSTVVNLSELGPAPTALDAVNYALQLNNIYEEVSPGWLETVGGVSAMDDSGASWMFMYNDEHSSTTLNQTNISNGDNIVLCLAVYDLTTYTYTTDYQYFKVIGYSSDVNGGSAYGEVTLALYNKKNIGWDSDYNIMWDITPVGNATIYVNKNQAYTPDGDWAVTDSMSGLATITLRGGTSAGIYNFDIGSMVEGSTNAYCRVTMIYDGSNAPVLLFSQPSAADTSLATVDLSLNEEEPIDALPYINKDGLIVNYAVDTARVSATPKDSNASIEAMFKGAGDADFSAYDLEEGESVSLAVGKNIFRFIVTNNEHEQDYTLVITRKDSNVGDISEDVNAVINGVKSVRVGDHLTDWILAMNTAGFTVPEADKMDYLAPALFHINSFADSGTGNVGPIAKTAIALTALGIDVRQIPDPDGGDAPINLINLIAGYEDSVDKYSAPYILSLYDLERTSGEKVYPLPADLVLTREKLIDVILDAQEGTGLFGSIDDTGMVFSALAPYYLAEEGVEVNGVNSEMMNEIKNAVDDAVTLLSEKQIIDGGFGDPNSNTTSTVIIGLAALNINPHSDDRFIKHGSTLITNLLSFRTTDNKLGYRSNATANDYACVQGFQALAAYKNLISQKNSNIYHFPAEVSVFTNWPEAKLLTGISVTKLPGKTTYNLNEGGGSATTVDTDGMEVTAYYNGELSNSKVIEEGYTVSTIDTTTPGTKVVIVTYQGHTTIFNVTVLDSSGSVPREETVKITIKSSGKGTIASDRAYVIESGKTTVMDVLKAVLSKAGVLYRVTYGEKYVEEIDGLGEFTGGENSGWLYYVNGVDPGISAADYLLEDGDVIEWFYTLDYTREEGAEKWNEFLLTEEITGTVDKNALNSALKEIETGKADNWTVSLALGEIAFDKEALVGLLDQISSDSVDITIEQASNKDLNAKQREAAGDRLVYNINVTSGKKNISEFGGKLTISLPYKLKEGESPLGVVVFYLDDEGNLIPLEGSYDPVSGKVVFTVDHLSYFMIGYDEALAKWPFTDVTEKDWFYTPVKYAYERGIFKGTSETTFAPGSPLTRAMLVAVLSRMSGADLSAYNDVSFNDVDIDRWYGPSVAWAKEAGVVSGYANKDGNFSFKPDDRISRQDIAVMLNNYNEKAAKKSYEQKETKLTFTDHQQIANYAKANVEFMQQAGIINGIKNADGSFRFQPLNNATRAEAATMIYNMLVEKN